MGPGPAGQEVIPARPAAADSESDSDGPSHGHGTVLPGPALGLSPGLLLQQQWQFSSGPTVARRDSGIRVMIAWGSRAAHRQPGPWPGCRPGPAARGTRAKAGRALGCHAAGGLK